MTIFYLSPTDYWASFLFLRNIIHNFGIYYNREGDSDYVRRNWIMNQREEVCRLANQLARERGGQPHQYMGEAWERIRQKQGLSTKRVPIKATKPRAIDVYDDDEDEESSDEYDYPRHRRTFGHHKSSGLKNMMRKSIKATADSCNFMKAPKDRPDEVFKGFNLKRTDPIPKIPDNIKRMFKIW